MARIADTEAPNRHREAICSFVAAVDRIDETFPARGQALIVNVGELLTQQARARPNSTALVVDDKRFTYEELDRLANQLANALRVLGVRRGERIAVLALNSLELVVAYWGVPRAGGILVPLNCWLRESELIAILEDCEPRILICDEANTPMGRSIKRRVKSIGAMLGTGEGADSIEHDFVSFLAAQSSNDSVTPPERSVDEALIIYSSGTTGRPKGIVHTHEGLVRTAATMVVDVGFRPDDVFLIFLPLFTAFLETLLPAIYKGACNVLLNKFEPHEVVEAIRRERITAFDNIPTTMQVLLERVNISRSDLHSVRMVYYASAPMPASIIQQWIDRFPNVEAIQFYGLSEFLCVTVQDWKDHFRKPGSVGRPMIGSEVGIVGEGGEELPRGATGEVICRGPYCMKEYWKNWKLTGETIRDGWLFTGDLGWLDQDGYLTLVGRKKEIIITGGVNVSPVEVEAVLLQHRDVREAAVIGVPHEKWGESIHAIVVPRAGAELTVDEIIGFCKDHLASYKKPVSVEFVNSLPKTGIGKVARAELKRKYLVRTAQSDGSKV